ncbi:carbon-nitrogen hydrolase family protein [Paenibacillus puerhi]|uniref:carbon-nitrogen hydrolase family protein n=1 Tax=Paenibacillus puerhi TaxID=2692622 RepID=UPI001357C44C|nr:carbon-nitrogen hydrolase family protein [Paenibacillus puerhi]
MTQLRVAAMQYSLEDLGSEGQFWNRLSLSIREEAGKGADLVVFPEYMTAHLLSLHPAMTHEEACLYLDGRTAEYVRFFRQCSREYQVGILGGTHICKDAAGYVNRAFLFFPDGRVETQDKLHVTPEERSLWSLVEGDRLNIIETEWGKLAILTCYDIEFPELGRMAADSGAELILCPSYTDTAFGYHRVRHCAQARAVENQLFVVLSGIVGELEDPRPQIDQGYGLAGVFTPCDFPFYEHGVQQAGELNRGMAVLADMDFSALSRNRKQGAVAPFFDRRPGLYARHGQAMVREW